MAEKLDITKSERLALLKFPPASPKEHKEATKEFEKILGKFHPVLERVLKEVSTIQDETLRSIFMKEEQAKYIRLVQFYEDNHNLKWWKMNPYAFKNNFNEIINPTEK